MKISAIETCLYESGYYESGTCLIGTVWVELDDCEDFIAETGYTAKFFNCHQVRLRYISDRWHVFVDSDFLPGNIPPRYALLLMETSIDVVKHYIYLEASLKTKTKEEGYKALENCLKEIKETLKSKIN